jgi:hypothetical protein
MVEATIILTMVTDNPAIGFLRDRQLTGDLSSSACLSRPQLETGQPLI